MVTGRHGDIGLNSGSTPEGSGWADAPSLEADRLTGSFWTFARMDEAPFSPFLVLAPGGLIGGHRHDNEQTWQVIAGRLVFFDRNGDVNTSFDRAQVVDGNIEALAGKVRLPGFDAVHCLRRTAHPSVGGRGREGSTGQVEFLTRPDRPIRPDLVVLRAGRSSLHPQWPADIAADYRTWDLCISYYGDHPSEAGGRPEWLTHQPAQRKFEALHDLFHHRSPLWNYERIWLPDDDLMTSWRDINRMFQLSRRFGLLLSQPSLAERSGCFINHDITRQRTDSSVRFTNFVEIMCPLFSREALRICIGSFEGSKTGFGLDHLWPRLLGSPASAIGILDEIAIVHTRPFAQNYDVYAAMCEEMETHIAYKFSKPEQQEIAAVRRR